MRKDLLNFIVDAIALLAILGLLLTGLTVTYLLPPGSRGGHGLTLWGLSRHDWGDVHFWLAISVVALFWLHVALHWTWVIVVVQRVFSRRGTQPRVPGALQRNLIGLGVTVVLAGLVGGTLWVASQSVARDGDAEAQDEHVEDAADGGGQGRGQGRGGGRGYRGGRSQGVIPFDQRAQTDVATPREDPYV
jgi:hypothetical protein